MKQILTVAGSDSGGGAGIQADIKSIHANGGFAMSVITSVTAQNTCEVTSAFDLPIEIITGNSIEMKKIIANIIDEKKLSANYSSSFNLGSIVITDKR